MKTTSLLAILCEFPVVFAVLSLSPVNATSEPSPSVIAISIDTSLGIITTVQNSYLHPSNVTLPIKEDPSNRYPFTAAAAPTTTLTFANASSNTVRQTVYVYHYTTIIHTTPPILPSSSSPHPTATTVPTNNDQGNPNTTSPTPLKVPTSTVDARTDATTAFDILSALSRILNVLVVLYHIKMTTQLLIMLRQ